MLADSVGMEDNTKKPAIEALSALDGRYACKMAGLAPIFSEYGLIRYRVLVELRWLQALAHADSIPELQPLDSTANDLLENIIISFDSRDAQAVKAIEAVTKHDVKAVEYWIKEKLQEHEVLAQLVEFVHFACTSEDINNLAYALMLKEARKTQLLTGLEAILQPLNKMARTYAEQPMLSRTHGQPASPTTLGKEIANTVARLQRQYEQLATVPITAKINGAVGNFNAHRVAYPEVDWPGFSQSFIESLGLSSNLYTTQIEPHDNLAEYFHIMSRCNTILIDFCRDIWGYIAYGYFVQKITPGQIGSSTMPHKINPIDFENAEGNLGVANALLQHMANKLPISRWQRDLSDSTVLRNIGTALGHSLLAYQACAAGLAKLTPDPERLAADLDQHWEVLGEAVQTVMRRYGLPHPYEQLKTYTQGKVLTQEQLQGFVETLDLPKSVKQRLRDLTPSTYTGYAAEFAQLSLANAD